VKSPPPELNSGRKYDIQSRHNALLKTFDIHDKIILYILKSNQIILLLIELIGRIIEYNSYTEKILIFSSELKMFLKIERHFEVKYIFIWLESS